MIVADVVAVEDAVIDVIDNVLEIDSSQRCE